MQITLEPSLTAQQAQAHWQALRQQVQARQLTAPVLTRTLVKTAVLAALLALALSWAWTAQALIWQTLAWLLIALVLAQFAFVGHDCGHGAVSRRPGVNRALGQFCMTVLTGLAFDEWIARHRAHHSFCQDETRDPDMAVDFMVSLTALSRARKGALGQWLTRHQATHIWLLSWLFGHSQRLLSQAAVLRHPLRYRLDAAALLLHFGLWLLLPGVLLQLPWSSIWLAYLLPLTLLGPYLAAIFWVNHIGMPLIAQVERFSFLEHQALSSRTIVNPPAWNWVFGGLNFQIEHHLFPQIPSHRLAAVQSIVRPYFSDSGLAYQATTWPQALRAIAAHLRTVAHTA